MKKILFGIATLLLITSCSGNGNRKSDKANEDPIRRSDSITATADSLEDPSRIIEETRLDSIRKDSIDYVSAGLTFQTFTSPKKLGEGNVTLQLLSSAKKVESNLIGLGFELVKTKKFKRNDYWDSDIDSTSYIEAILNTYSKEIDGRSTVVSVESSDNQIIELSVDFPDSKDLEEFKKTVKGKIKDNKEFYWELKIRYKGNKVTLQEQEAG